MTDSVPDWPRPVVHWEIVAADPRRLSEFYRAMFGWTIDGSGPVLMVDPGLGGPEPGPGGHFSVGEPRGVRLYVQVRDLRASLERVTELGGTVLGEPFDVPGGPTLAPVADPEGNRLVLVQQ